ncbi:hypothetical protein NLG97_g8853 [Lecanicillium saksenae]|uniref:Uncharacterized protein n=1 Tax=Lecanicillium saksenae TaxID=468837 RepID=A0ACC1QHV8_9HYPO|nr:hypothetical protein NLG97_g8853 [Lecanicillium saksenae]
MFLQLPVEIISAITEASPLAAQSALAQTCRSLHGICNRILYRSDSRQYGSSAIFHAIACYVDQKVIISTLQAAATAGTSLEHCRQFSKVSESPRQVFHGEICAPLYLASTKGLDDVVAFLIRSGVSLEGLPGTFLTPFWGAVLARQETAALMLLQHGASTETAIEGLDIFHAAIQYNLLNLVDYLVVTRKVDVNSRTKSGATPIMLAISSGRGRLVPKLLRVGANAVDALLKACHDHFFTNALLLLDAAAAMPTWNSALPLSDVAHLTVFVATQKGRGTRVQQKALVRQLLLVIRRHFGSRCGPSLKQSCEPSLAHANALMENLLRQLLCIDGGDTDMASLLMYHGVQLPAGTFLELLNVLQLAEFCANRPGVLRRHPKMTDVFHLVHSQCSATPKNRQGVLMRYFLRQLPSEAVELVSRMRQQDLAPPVRGVETMSVG